MLYWLIRLLDWFLRAAQSLVLLYCVCSWFPALHSAPWFSFLSRLMEPLAAPFRGIGRWIMRKTGLAFDFTFCFVLLALQLLDDFLWRILW